MNHWDYVEAGFRVLSLHTVDKKGICGCGNPDCKAQFKHPRAKNWQNTPHWSDEQLDTMEKYGQFKTGFGVLVDDHLVVDIDPRNGGFESYEKLDMDLEAMSGFVVETGGGGLHIYFKRPKGVPLLAHLHGYPGVDFKSTGFVVGCGSVHKSGATYERKKGAPDQLTDIPPEMLALLERKEAYRASYEGSELDVTDNDIKEMVGYLDHDGDYDSWVRVGMAIHHATQGAGLHLWDEWSSEGVKYPGFAKLEHHWHSFGKSANPVTIGTLIHYAEQAGYTMPVTFEYEESADINETITADLLRPPGFVGQITQWINDQCRFPRERLAVAAALSAIGNIGGLRFQDETYGVTSNQFVFCVAGSATGKEAVQQAQASLHQAAGIAPATHGAIKSEQEIVRNLINHQAALYIIDEMGLVLQKIKNARLRGGAAYLEGVIGMLMSAYSKANSRMLLSGDVREAVRHQLSNEIAKLRKAEDYDGKDLSKSIDAIDRQLASLDNGLERPFLSLIGYTTPVTFNDLVDYEQSANGFFGRSLVVHEKDTNPKPKKRFKPAPMPDDMEMTLSVIANGGSYDATRHRIEYRGERVQIPTDEKALNLLDQIEDELHERAERAKEMALEAIPRRAFELVLKVSLTLAIPEGVRTLEHVRWAYEFVKNDISNKMNLAAQNMAHEDKRHGEAIMRRIIGQLDNEKGETIGVLANRCRPHKKDDIEKALKELATQGRIRGEKSARSVKWFLVG